MKITILFEVILPLILLIILLLLFKNNLFVKLNKSEKIGFYFTFLFFLLYEVNFSTSVIQISQLIINFLFIGVAFLMYLLIKENGFFQKFNLIAINNHSNDSILAKDLIENNNNQKKIMINESKGTNDSNDKGNSIINKLSEKQLEKILYFFEDKGILKEKLSLSDFKDKFLNKPILISTDVPILREFYNHLKDRKEVKIPNITIFLKVFINSEKNEPFNYKQFTKDAKPISKLSNEIIQLFEKL